MKIEKLANQEKNHKIFHIIFEITFMTLTGIQTDKIFTE